MALTFAARRRRPTLSAPAIAAVHRGQIGGARREADRLQRLYYILDVHRRLVRANRAFCALTGLSPATALGRPIASTMHPQDTAQTCPVCRAEEEIREAVIVLEATHPANPGHVPLEITVAITRDALGQPTGFLVARHDLSRDRALQAAIAASEERLRRVSALTSDLIFVCRRGSDGLFRTEWIGGNAEKPFGLSAADIDAMGCWRPLVLDENGPVFARNITALVPGQRSDFELRVRHRDGSLHYVRCVAEVERDPATGGEHLFGALEDISERKAVEAELKAHRDRLEELVAERTAQLAKALDAAESANRAKSVFLANMSHELRTPLNAILGFAQILERDPSLPADKRASLATIHRSGRHLLALINDLLEISHVDAGPSLSSFDLPAMLGALADVMATRAAGKGLRWRMTLASDLPQWVRSDETKLHQVLSNLLSNAIKYTPQSEIELRVECLPRTEGHSGDELTLAFTVSDTGVGIDPAELEKIFQPFYQTEYGIRLGEGTGLGLAINREYARILGGELTVHCQPGAGTQFRFVLSVTPGEASGGRMVLQQAGERERIEMPEDAVLAGLTWVLRQRLRDAALAHDSENVLAIVNEIEGQDRRLARQVRALVGRYAFDRLVSLLDRAARREKMPQSSENAERNAEESRQRGAVQGAQRTATVA